MKKFLSTSLSLMLVLVIAYAGSGINAYSFCCDDCYTIGIEAIVGQKCCDVHIEDCSTSEQTTHEREICDTSHQQCELDRLNLDLQDGSTQANQLVIKSPFIKSLFTATFFSLIKTTENEPLTEFISQTQKPPNQCRLVYFSLLETLII